MAFLAPCLLFIVGIGVFVQGIPTYATRAPTGPSVMLRSYRVFARAVRRIGPVQSGWSLTTPLSGS